MTETLPIPVSAILGLGLCVVLNVPRPAAGENAAQAVFEAFSSSLIFLLISSFILARAMGLHGLGRRFALRVLTLPGVSGSTYRVIITLGAVAVLISSVMPNSAATAMLLPIGVGIVGSLGSSVVATSGRAFQAEHSTFAAATVLMVAYGASIGGLLTPIGSPANLIGRAFLENQTSREISFLQWAATAGPMWRSYSSSCAWS
ncbi:SLC13 family permease [Streptomyces malaysiensis]|uniref:SLC13 family permease n=1 Tax=Streptomyces malaysiensis TaxID=92644 RepID=UPI00142F1C16|nr:SLC13 family permease [Streptomyces malaysiensis]